MIYLPTIYRTRFSKEKNLFMDHITYLPRCGGTYLEKGRFKAFYKTPDSKEELVFEEGTVMIPGFYKPKDSNKFLEMPENHYLQACTYGWNLTALDESSIIDCVFYPFAEHHPSYLVNETTIPGQGVKVWDEFIDRVPRESGPVLCSAIYIEDTKTIEFPDNWFIVVVKGNVLINGIEKQKRKWLRSSKNQEIVIENNTDKPSLIFLLE